jgi:hypothetical protein
LTVPAAASLQSVVINSLNDHDHKGNRGQAYKEFYYGKNWLGDVSWTPHSVANPLKALGSTYTDSLM